MFLNLSEFFEQRYLKTSSVSLGRR